MCAGRRGVPDSGARAARGTPLPQATERAALISGPSVPAWPPHPYPPLQQQFQVEWSLRSRVWPHMQPPEAPLRPLPHFLALTPPRPCLFAQLLPADLLARIFALCACELRLDGAAPHPEAAATPVPARRHRAAHRRGGKAPGALQAAASAHGSDEGSADGQPAQRCSSSQPPAECGHAAPEAVRTRASAPAVAHVASHQGPPSSSCAALAPASFAAAGERARAAAAAMAPPAWQPPPPRDST